MAHYEAEATTYQGKPAIEIRGFGLTKMLTYGGSGYRDIVLTQDFYHPILVDAYAVKELGWPPPPDEPLGGAVETFLDFGDCAFDARDIIAVAVQDAPLAVMASDGCHPFRLVMRFRQGPTDIMFIAFPTAEERDTVYARIVAAMKASRA